MKKNEIKKILGQHGKWLQGADTGARADLRNADLCDADLRGADLRGANLRGADLCDADLRGADLRGADLRNADLCDADLPGADLRGANYTNTILNLQCPEEGEFIGYRKCKGDIIVKLLIPSDAKRSSATSRKCRASKAKVLEIYGATEAVSQYDPDFVYRVGETVEPTEPFDDNRWNECGSGIHFFITRKEAEEYN